MSRSVDSPVDLICERLRQRARPRRRSDYRIPALWNCWGYDAAQRIAPRELAVDPYDYLRACLDQVILPARGRRELAGRSLSQIERVRRSTGRSVVDKGKRRRAGDWIRRATLYSMLVRTTTAWDHNGDGRLRGTRWTETGTFLKSILLLPLLKRMGMSVVYLLPVSKCSQRFRKGEVGCPYSAQNFFELEPELHDRLLGSDAGDVDLEFSAFVEAAHALDIRVMVDLAPRTAARNSDLILEHPDWFYWIDRTCARGFGPPRVEDFTEWIPKPGELKSILAQPALREHLSKFRFAPNVSDSGRWKRFVAHCRRQPPRDLLAEIGREFGLTTAPAFSDCINDPQPPWSDVTFLRLFLDHPAASARHLPDPARQPPYAFTDSIKSSLFSGRRPNRPLWQMLANILPFYQRFGVDGARVDMGHALPTELQDLIVSQPRRRDPDFCFLAEQFDHAAASQARRAGYNAILGSACFMEPRSREGELHKLVHELLPGTALPSLAAAETPDTPRAVVREGGKAFARLAAVLNSFLPGAVPQVNSGLEIFERQPMNLGLDVVPPGRFALARSDPYYGKLAYFDRVALHWGNAGGRAMVELLGRAGAVREEYIDVLSDLRNYFAPHVERNAKHILAVGWRLGLRAGTLVVVANTDYKRRRHAIISRLPAPRRKRAAEVLLEVCASAKVLHLVAGRLSFVLGPGEVKVLRV